MLFERSKSGTIMENKSVLKAVDEARRFIEKAVVVLDDERETKFSYFGSKNTGSLRRASLDLTRALADMRKP